MKTAWVFVFVAPFGVTACAQVAGLSDLTFVEQKSSGKGSSSSGTTTSSSGTTTSSSGTTTSSSGSACSTCNDYFTAGGTLCDGAAANAYYAFIACVCLPANCGGSNPCGASCMDPSIPASADCNNCGAVTATGSCQTEFNACAAN